jgi:hypothetical protein
MCDTSRDLHSKGACLPAGSAQLKGLRQSICNIVPQAAHGVQRLENHTEESECVVHSKQQPGILARLTLSGTCTLQTHPDTAAIKRLVDLILRMSFYFPLQCPLNLANHYHFSSSVGCSCKQKWPFVQADQWPRFLSIVI